MTGRRYEEHLIGHVEVVPDGSLVRCDNRLYWTTGAQQFKMAHVVLVHVHGVMQGNKAMCSRHFYKYVTL